MANRYEWWFECSSWSDASVRMCYYSDTIESLEGKIGAAVFQLQCSLKIRENHDQSPASNGCLLSVFTDLEGTLINEIYCDMWIVARWLFLIGCSLSAMQQSTHIMGTYQMWDNYCVVKRAGRRERERERGRRRRKRGGHRDEKKKASHTSRLVTPGKLHIPNKGNGLFALLTMAGGWVARGVANMRTSS